MEGSLSDADKRTKLWNQPQTSEVEDMMKLETRSLEAWSGVRGRPLFIAGPCSAESEEQIREAARRLATTRVDFLRAGIWKPRI